MGQRYNRAFQPSAIAFIRLLLKTSTVKEVAGIFKVTQRTIYRIRNLETYPEKSCKKPRRKTAR